MTFNLPKSTQFGMANIMSGFSAQQNHTHFLLSGEKISLGESSSQIEKDPLANEHGFSSNSKLLIKTEAIEESDHLKTALSSASEKEIWIAIRERIFSQYGLWDILVDKAILNDTREQDSHSKGDAKRFQAVVQEVEALLGEFKCFMDACLVHADPLEGTTSPLCIGPELRRAFKIPSDVDWKMRDKDKINYLYRSFFDNDNKEDEESDDDHGAGDGDDSYDNCPSPEIRQDLKPNICVRCERSFPSMIQLQNHEKSCKQRRPPITVNCKWKRRISDGRIFCKFENCEATFPSVLALWNHFQENHALPEEFNFRCNTCQACFVHPEILKRHRQAAHVAKSEKVAKEEEVSEEEDDGNCQYQCPKCTRRFKSRQHIEKHLEKCKGIPPPPTLKPIWQKQSDGRFTCAVAGCTSNKSWTSSFSVWYHFNSEHASMSDEKYCVFKCDLCEDKFPTRSMLNRHKNHKHEEMFRFQCSKCPKKLPSNKLLKVTLLLESFF